MAGVAVLVAATGHWAGGGAWAPLAVMVPVAGVTAVLAWALSGRRHRTVVLAALLFGSQAAVHLLTCYLHGHLMMPSLGMLLAHVTSSVLAGALLHHLDALWWALVGPLVVLVRLLWWGEPAPRRRLVWAEPLRLHPPSLTHSVARRGPPLF